jgi:hypothetical protein
VSWALRAIGGRSASLKSAATTLARKLAASEDAAARWIGKDALQPTKKHAEVMRFVEPEEFERYREAGIAMGFRFVASGPLVRSSYRAAEAFLHGVVRGEKSAPPSEVDRYGRKHRLRVLG